MAKFLYIYHGGGMPETPEAQAAAMQAWGDWIGGLGAAFVDPGNPVGMSKTVSAAGVADDGGANPCSGYGIVEADSFDQAVDWAKACPIVADGGSVEVAQTFEI